MAAGGLLALVSGVRLYPDRSAMAGIIVGAIFMLIAALLVAGVWHGAVASRRKDALQAANPGKPWMWREDWASGIITDSNRAGVIALWIFAIIWNAVSFPIAITQRKEIFGPNHLALFILLFPVAGVFVFYGAVYQTLRSMKFGTSKCHLERVPIVPGRLFRGDIQINTDLQPENGYHLRLVSIHSVTTGRGRSRTTHETILFDNELTVDASAAMRGPNGTRVPFQFATPPDSQSTNETNLSNRYFWRLSVTAAMPGIDYAAQFEVPVFQTGEAADGAEFEAFQHRRRAEVVRHTVKEAAGVAVKRLPGGGEEFQLTAAKTFGSVFKSLLFLAIWNAGLVALIHYGAPWFIDGFFIVIDLLLLVASIDYFAGKTTVTVDRAGVRLRKTWFGQGGTQSIAADSIASIDAMAISAQNGSSFGVMLKLRDNTTQRVGAYIQDRESADIIAAKMMADLGRDSATP